MGNLYTSDEPLDYEQTYCETCGDSDWLIGYANTREETWNLLKSDTETYSSRLSQLIKENIMKKKEKE